MRDADRARPLPRSPSRANYPRVSPSAPRADYEQRLNDRRAAVSAFDRRDATLANLRLVVALLALGAAYAVWGAPDWSALWLLACAAAFVVLVVVHEGIVRRRAAMQRAVRFYERGLMRLDGKWAGEGRQGERFLDADHPYAADLDLFGKGSLFELLCTAHTLGGEERLATWLKGPAPIGEVRARQDGVRELSNEPLLREALYVSAGEAAPELHPQALVAWAEAPPVFSPTRARLLWPALLALSALGVASLVLWGLGFGPGALVLLLFVDLAVVRALGKRAQRPLEVIEEPGRELRILSGLLLHFERHDVQAELLRRLRGTLTVGGAASVAIAKLARLIELADAKKNQLFAPIAFLLMWGPLFSLAVESWRRRHGPRVRAWLESLSDLEALASLATYAYERPIEIFPTLREGGPSYEAQGLAHPLLGEEAVPNDVQLSTKPALLVISGSNMSGKSTLLRSVGTSVVMAFAGAPVRARALALSPLAVGATLRVQDSLLLGASRFYAEIRRLEAILDIAAARPLLFLLDEVLHGTNSHDRRQGAAAVIAALLERGAIGLVTTHDLALAELEERFSGRALNVHFADELAGDKLVFDYVMKPGVVQKSNAIALMRAVGLPV